MTQSQASDLQAMLDARFADAPSVTASGIAPAKVEALAARGSCRAFLDQQVPDALVDTLCALAMASPTKSDLQQRDIVLLRAVDRRAAVAELVPEQPWIAGAPMLAVFCGNNRRQRLLHEWHDVPFANDHLDAFLNAAADAAIALGAFVTAAEAIGLGCCPISGLRNAAQKVSELLELPAHVFPFAGLAFGYPQSAPHIAPRLPLGVTCHVDRYAERDLRAAVAGYDKGRAEAQPYGNQRFTQIFGTSHDYGWSEDKVRQYSQPERADFGAYVRARGFCLD